VAVPGVPEVTVVVPHPVLALHVTLPVTISECTPGRLTNPYCPGMLAVNVKLCPYPDGVVPAVKETVMVPAPA
jgi:hypothetical protein